MDNKNFSPKILEVIEKSRGEAIRLGHSFVTTEHLLLGIINERNNLAVKVTHPGLCGVYIDRPRYS